MDWEVLDLKIVSWLSASRLAVRTLFYRERILVDQVFSSSDAIREVVFAEIAGDAAVQFLALPELVAKSKRSPEKIFRLLDLYDAICELWQDIEPVFCFESTAAVRTQALNSIFKLAEALRGTLTDFESAIQKESSTSPVPGGGVHPLTRYAMRYIALLADYETTLSEIFADFPVQTTSPIPDFFFDKSQAAPPRPLLQYSSATSSPASNNLSSSLNEDKDRSAIAVRLAWLVLVLLCKLDSKAVIYRNVSLSYLFLANNTQYIVRKVQSSRLSGMLGGEWVARHAAKARQHAAGYERVAWGKVAAAVPAREVSPGEARERMRAFSAALEEACTTQAGWLLEDPGMREDVRAAVHGMVVPAYRGFHEKWSTALEDAAAVRFSPEDVRERLAELFSSSGPENSDSVSSSSSWSKASARSA